MSDENFAAARKADDGVRGRPQNIIRLRQYSFHDCAALLQKLVIDSARAISDITARRWYLHAVDVTALPHNTQRRQENSTLTFYARLIGAKGSWRTGNNIMTFAAVLAFLVGAILAQRFRVFALVPVLALTIFVAFGIVIMVGADSWQTALGAIIALVGVQVGYLVNAPFRVGDIVARGRRPRSAAIEKPKSTVDPLAVSGPASGNPLHISPVS